MTPDGSTMLRSPREASSTFSLGGPFAPRPKNLFYVQFTKSGTVSPWQRVLGFIAKSVERPGAQVQTEELNQYNKRRVINTGIKHNPIRMRIYDTIDSQAVQMWDEYAKQYFGDYRHENNYVDFQSDIINNQWNDYANGGFGFAPYAVSPNVTDNNAQFFLQGVSIYQVFGGNYVQFDVYNPKITSFELDELSYDSNDIGTVSMQIAYEAVTHVNSGVPQPISSNAILTEVFGTSSFDGDVLDFPSTTPIQQFSSMQTPTASSSAYYQSTSTSVGTLSDSAAADVLGALSAFGAYNFGSLSQSQQSAIGTELSALAAQNPQLAALLNLTSTANGSIPAANLLANPYNTQSGINAQVYAIAQSVAQSAAGAGLAASGINLATALMAAISGKSAAAAAGGQAASSSPAAAPDNSQNAAGGAAAPASAAPTSTAPDGSSTAPASSTSGASGDVPLPPPRPSDLGGDSSGDVPLPPPRPSDLGGDSSGTGATGASADSGTGVSPSMPVYATLNSAGDASMQYGANTNVTTPQLSSIAQIQETWVPNNPIDPSLSQTQTALPSAWTYANYEASVLEANGSLTRSQVNAMDPDTNDPSNPDFVTPDTSTDTSATSQAYDPNANASGDATISGDASLNNYISGEGTPSTSDSSGDSDSSDW